MISNRLSKILLTVAGVSFLFNIIWENLQAPLYQWHGNFWQQLPICFIASLGDVLIILILYFILATLNRNVFWTAKLSRTDAIIVIVLGVLIAVGIEKWALAVGRWQYNSAMPLIPYVEVGLLPVLQMALLPLLAYYASKYIVD